MAAKDIEAGRAYVLLRIRNQLSQGLKVGETMLKGFGKNIATVGAGLVGATAGAGAVIGGAMAKFVGFGSALNDAAGRTGASAQALSEYQYAAEMTGASLEDVEKALKTMAKNGKAADQFDSIAASIAAIPDPTKQAQAALKQWGKAGLALLPMARDLGAFRDEAQALGISMTNEQASAADDLGDAWDRLTKSGTGIVYQLTGTLAPTLTGIAEDVLGVIKRVRGWINQNAELIIPIAKGIAIVGAFGAGLVALGGLFVALGAGAGLMGSALGVIFSPIGLLIGSLVGLGIAAYVFRDRIASALSAVAGFFAPGIAVVREIGSIFSATFGGMVAELMSGNLSGAATIAFAGIQAAAWTGVAGIGAAINWALDAMGQWIPGVNSIREYLGSAFQGIGQAILNGQWDIAGKIAMLNLQISMQTGIAAIQFIWGDFLVSMKNKWVDFWGALDESPKTFATMWDVFLNDVVYGLLVAKTGIDWVFGKDTMTENVKQQLEAEKKMKSVLKE